MTETRLGGPRLSAERRMVLPALAAAGATVAVLLATLPFEGNLPIVVGATIFGAVAAAVLERIPIGHPFAEFGVGNGITLLRSGGVAVFCALAVEPGLLVGYGAWLGVAGAVGLLALDGLDGWAARRQGLASRFGARFDLEVDTLLILALAALAAGTGKAGPWVLALGLMRYGFVFAGLLWPGLARPLAPSTRRKTVCVLQIVVLSLLLAPPVAPPSSQLLAGAALAALTWSFALDVLALTARAR